MQNKYVTFAEQVIINLRNLWARTVKIYGKDDIAPKPN